MADDISLIQEQEGGDAAQGFAPDTKQSERNKLQPFMENIAQPDVGQQMQAGAEAVDRGLQQYNIEAQSQYEMAMRAARERVAAAQTASEGDTAQSIADRQLLASQLAMPFSVVTKAQEEAKRELVIRNLSQNQYMAQWAGANEINATYARDYLDTVVDFFKGAPEWGNDLMHWLTFDSGKAVERFGYNLTEGAAQANKAFVDFGRMFADNVGLTSASQYLGEVSKSLERYRNLAEQNGVGRPKEEKVGALWDEFVKSVPQQVWNLASLALFKRPLPGALAVGAGEVAGARAAAAVNPLLAKAGEGLAGTGIMGAQIAGGSYGELREQGVSPEIAGIAAAGNALMQAPMERFGMERFVDIFRAKGMKEAMLKAVASLFSEGGTEWAQKWPEYLAHTWALSEKHGNNVFDRANWFLSNLFDWKNIQQANDEAMLEAAVGAMWGGLGGGVRIAMTRNMQQRAQEQADFLLGIRQVTQMAIDKGLPPEVVKTMLEAKQPLMASTGYVDAEAALTLYQDGNAAVLDALGVTEEELTQLADEGGAVPIQLSDLETRVDQATFDKLYQHVSIRPGSLTAAESAQPMDADAYTRSALAQARRRANQIPGVSAELSRMYHELLDAGITRQQARDNVTLEAVKAATLQAKGFDALSWLERRKYVVGEDGQTYTVPVGLPQTEGAELVSEDVRNQIASSTDKDALSKMYFDNQQAAEFAVDEQETNRLQAVNRMVEARLAMLNELEQRGWHGSPHDTFDRFDDNAIGTGEGNATHGHGHYIAEERDISDDRYRRRLVRWSAEDGDRRVMVNGQEHAGLTEIMRADRGVFNAVFDKDKDTVRSIVEEVEGEAALAEKNVKSLEDAKAQVEGFEGARRGGYRLPKYISRDEFYDILEKAGVDSYELSDVVDRVWEKAAAADGDGETLRSKKRVVQAVEEEIAFSRENAAVSRERAKSFSGIDWDTADIRLDKEGQLYEVEIPEEDEMLQEDAHMAMQPEAVRKAAAKLYVETLGYNEDTNDPNAVFYAYTGRRLYRELADVLGSQEAASDALYEAGIKGISYIGETDGHAWVVFKGADIQIVQTYFQGPGPKPDAETVGGPELYQVQNLPEWKERLRAWGKANEVPAKKIEKFIKGIEGQMKIIDALKTKDGLAISDLIAEQVRGAGQAKKGRSKAGFIASGPVRTNIDEIYQISFDASSMCVKRLSAAKTAAAVQSRIGRPLTADENMALIALYRAEGKEAPCIYCYVESNRRRATEAVGAARDMIAGTKDIPDGWKPDRKKKVEDAREEFKKAGLTREDINADFVLDPATADTEQALETKKKFPAIYGFLNFEAANTKQNKVKLYEEYVGNLLDLKKEQVELLNGYAGLRFFSTSDFQIEHVVDLMQAFADMAAIGAKSHAYTKVPLYVDVFGDTGQKINMSCFAEEDPETGEIRPDVAQGWDWEKAKEMRAAHKDCGVILVASSDKVLRWAMEQDWIDYIIPFHYSGLSNEYYNTLGWQDFQAIQTEQAIEGLQREITDTGAEKGRVRMHEITNPKKEDKVKGVSDKVGTRRYLTLCKDRGLYPVFTSFCFKQEVFADIEEKYAGKLKNAKDNEAKMNILSTIRGHCGKRAKAMWKDMVEKNKIDWSKINEKAFKFKKDYARTDTAFNVVNPAKINMKAAAAPLQETIEAGLDEKYKEDPSITEKMVKLIEWSAENGNAPIGAKALQASRAKVDPMSYIMGGPAYPTAYKRPNETQGITLHQSAPIPENPLVALHNISEARLLDAAKLGGLPVPSLGITKADSQYEGFGDIYLIGSRDMVDPSTTPVFNRDAYTARFPNLEYGPVKTDKILAFRKQFKEAFKDFEESKKLYDTENALYDAEQRMRLGKDPDNTAYGLSRTSSAKVAFLNQKGIDFEPVYVVYDKEAETGSMSPEIQALVKRRGWKSGNEVTVDDIPEITEAYIKAISNGKYDDHIKRVFLRRIENHDNRLSLTEADRLIQAALDDPGKQGQQVYDKRATTDKLESAVKPMKEEYRAWIDSLVADKYGVPLVPVGRRRLPLTLENVVKAMTSKKVRNQEKTLGFGTGEMRAATAKQLKTLEDYNKFRDSIVDELVGSDEKDRLEALVYDFKDSVSEGYDYRWNDSFEKSNEMSKALADAANKKGNTKKALAAALEKHDFVLRDEQKSEAALNYGVQVIELLRNGLATYMEAKPQRAVKLNEFLGAVIPDNTSQEARKVLADNGIAVAEYRAGNTINRQLKIEKLSRQLAEQQEKTVLFEKGQNTPRGSYTRTASGEDLIRIFRGHDASTVQHESAHAYHQLLEDMAADDGTAARQACMDALVKTGMLEGVAEQYAGLPVEELGQVIADLQAQAVQLDESMNAEGADKEGIKQEKQSLLAQIDALTQLQKHHVAVEQARHDLRTIREWAGVPVDGTLTREQYIQVQEQFARGFEGYLATGKAPTTALAGVFARFKQWLLAVYKNIRDYVGADITPEIKDIYDRMLATEEEMQADEVAQAMLGEMPDAIAMLGCNASDAAYLEDLLTRAHMAASSRVDKERNKDRKKRFKAAKEQALTDLLDTPLWRLATGGYGIINYESLKEFLGDKDANELRKKLPKVIKSGEGSTIDVIAMGFEGDAQMSAQFDGNADDLAQLLYEHIVLNGETLNGEATALANQALESQDAEYSVEDGFLAGDEYGEFLDALEDEAAKMQRRASAKGKKKAEAREAAAEQKAEEAQAEAEAKAKAKAEQEARLAGVRAERKALWHEYERRAKEELDATPVGQIDPKRYAKMLRKALKGKDNAILSRDPDKAVEAVRKARYAYALMRESKRRRDMVERNLTMVEKLCRRKPGDIAPIPATALARLLQKYGFRVPKRWGGDPAHESDTMQAMASACIAEAQGEDTVEVTPDLAEWVMQEAVPDYAQDASWQSLTWADYNDLMDVFNFFVHASKEQNQNSKDSMKARVEFLVEQAVQSMQGMQTQTSAAKGTWHRAWQNTWRRIFGAIQALQWQFRKADGFKNAGPKGEAGALESLVMRPILDGENEFRARMKELSALLAPHLEALRQTGLRLQAELGNKNGELIKLGVKLPEALALSEGRSSWTTDQVIALALNCGNEGNRQRITGGYPDLSYNTLAAIVGSDLAAQICQDNDIAVPEDATYQSGIFTADDWAAVQCVWDAIETLWEPTVKVHREMYGFAPRRVDVTPMTFRAQGVEVALNGGYYPIYYDKDISLESQQWGERDDIISTTESFFPAPSAKRGHTKSRQKKTKHPLRLATSTLMDHVQDALKLICFGEAVRFADMVTKHPVFAAEYTRVFGQEDYKSIRPNLKGVVRSEPAPKDAMIRLANATRKYLVSAGLWGNLKVAILQTTALGPAMGDLGAVPVWQAMGRVATGGWGLIREIQQASPYMMSRWRAFDQDLLDKAQSLDINKRPKTVKIGTKEYSWDDVVNMGMTPLCLVDLVTSGAIWQAAYTKYMKDKGLPGSLDQGNQYHSEAVKFADEEVKKSNPDFDASSRSAFLRAQNSYRLFNAFGSAVTLMAQRGEYMLQAMKHGRITKAQFARWEAYEMLAPAVAMTLIMALARGIVGGGDDDGEKLFELFLESLLDQYSMKVPFFGSIIESTIESAAGISNSGRQPTMRTVVDTPINLFYRLPTAAVKAWDGDDEAKKKLSYAIGDIVSFILRVPVSKTVRNIERGEAQRERGEGTYASWFMPAPGK